MPFGKVMLYLVAIFLPPSILLSASASFSRIFPKKFFDPEEWNGKRKSEPAVLSPSIHFTSGLKALFAHFLKNFLICRVLKKALHMTGNDDVSLGSPSIYFTSGMGALFADFFKDFFQAFSCRRFFLHRLPANSSHVSGRSLPPCSESPFLPGQRMSAPFPRCRTGRPHPSIAAARKAVTVKTRKPRSTDPNRYRCITPLLPGQSCRRLPEDSLCSAWQSKLRPACYDS